MLKAGALRLPEIKKVSVRFRFIISALTRKFTVTNQKTHGQEELLHFHNIFFGKPDGSDFFLTRFGARSARATRWVQ